MKLPVFWPDSCKSWFINAGSQFHLKNITASSTKFHHVVASLPQKEIDNGFDIIRNPPAADPYSALKSRLLQTHSLTDYAGCESFMSLPLSKDMLPSVLLSRMWELLPIEHQECLFLGYAFLRQLPANVRSHLVHDNTMDIALLFQRADEIYRSSLSPSSLVNAVDSVHAVNTPFSRQNRRAQRSQHPPSRYYPPIPLLLGPLHYIWSRRKMEDGDSEAITAISTLPPFLTIIHFPLSPPSGCLSSW